MDFRIQKKTALILQYQSGNYKSCLVTSKLTAPKDFVKRFFLGAAGLRLSYGCSALYCSPHHLSHAYRSALKINRLSSTVTMPEVAQ